MLFPLRLYLAVMQYFSPQEGLRDSKTTVTKETKRFAEFNIRCHWRCLKHKIFHKTGRKIEDCRTLSCLLSDGKRANNCMAKIIVAKTCQEEGRRDAKHTDAKMEAFSEADLDTLKKYLIFIFYHFVRFVNDTRRSVKMENYMRGQNIKQDKSR